jgi:hypothetical protein
MMESKENLTDIKQCSYGCNLPALFLIGKNLRPCCSRTFHRCPAWIQRREDSYVIHYGVRHPSQAKEVKKKIEQTCLDRFGTTSPLGNADVQAKREATCVEKYGGTSPTSSPEVMAKIRSTNLERYGSAAPAGSVEVQNKMQTTNLERYGEDNFFKTKDFDRIRKETSLLKYGVDHPSKSPEVQKKWRVTNLEKYGFEHPFQNPAVVEKYVKTRYAKDPVVLSTGKVVYLQGYEKRVFGELLDNGMRDSDFEFDRKKQPVFWYGDPVTNKRRRYFPDFYIPRLKWVIEVKSDWTLFGRDWWAENKAKRAAVVAAGYKFNFIIR